MSNCLKNVYHHKRKAQKTHICAQCETEIKPKDFYLDVSTRVGAWIERRNPTKEIEGGRHYLKKNPIFYKCKLHLSCSSHSSLFIDHLFPEFIEHV